MIKTYKYRLKDRRAETVMGSPCRHGHAGERYARGGECVECRKARDANPVYREARAQRDAANPGRAMDRVRKYQATTRGRAVRLIHSAASRCDLVTITPEWVEQRLELGLCELSGLPFDFATSRLQGAYSPSLDRIDPGCGYTPENTRVILWALNAALSHWGAETFKTIAEAWLGRSVAAPVEESRRIAA